METSASFEARSAPSLYPTTPPPRVYAPRRPPRRSCPAGLPIVSRRFVSLIAEYEASMPAFGSEIKAGGGPQARLE